MIWGDRLMLALLVQYVVIAAVFGWQANWPKALYWTGAAVITSAVLWME